MDLETLKQLLKNGVITQEQFDELSLGQSTLEDEDKEAEEETETEDKAKDKKELDIETMIQKAIDRATNKLGNDNKRLKEELEKERKKNLTVEELKELEIKEKESEVAERERIIKEKESRLYAITALKKAGLDNGNKDSLELIDIVLGEDESAIESNVKALQKFEQTIRKKVTDEIYKTNGRNPDKGGTSASEDNPYKKETFNFTKQMELEASNPDEAKRLMQIAGLN